MITSRFSFAEFDQLEFTEQRIDNQLTALFAYYAYLIIGIDLDSFAPKGGEDILQRCMNLTNNAQNLDYPGWKAFSDNRNRFAIISDYLDGALEPFRSCNTTIIGKGSTKWRIMRKEAYRDHQHPDPGLKKATENRPLSLLPQIWTDYQEG